MLHSKVLISKILKWINLLSITTLNLKSQTKMLQINMNIVFVLSFCIHNDWIIISLQKSGNLYWSKFWYFLGQISEEKWDSPTSWQIAGHPCPSPFYLRFHPWCFVTFGGLSRGSLSDSVNRLLFFFLAFLLAASLINLCISANTTFPRRSVRWVATREHPSPKFLLSQRWCSVKLGGLRATRRTVEWSWWSPRSLFSTSSACWFLFSRQCPCFAP